MVVMTSRSNEVTRAVTEYLQKHFHKPPLGALARWSGESGEYTYALRAVVEHEATPAIHGWSLVRVTAHEDFLSRTLQGGGSEGIFAVQHGEVLYLTPEHPENISRVLRADRLAGEVAPEKIAALCCEVLLSRPNARYSVLLSGDEISSWYPEARGYVRDRHSAARLERELAPPRWEQEHAAARLVFYALVAGFQSYQALRVTVTVPESEPVQSNEEVVVNRVFERCPVVRTR
jgi:hypothetical protein